MVGTGFLNEEVEEVPSIAVEDLREGEIQQRVQVRVHASLMELAFHPVFETLRFLPLEMHSEEESQSLLSKRRRRLVPADDLLDFVLRVVVFVW